MDSLSSKHENGFVRFIKKSLTFIKFSFSSILTIVIDLALFYLISKIMNHNIQSLPEQISANIPLFANIPAKTISGVIAFFLFKNWSFRKDSNSMEKNESESQGKSELTAPESDSSSKIARFREIKNRILENEEKNRKTINTGKQFLKFIFTFVIKVAISTVAISFLSPYLLSHLDISRKTLMELGCKIFVDGILFLINYFVQKYWVFRHN